MSMAKIEPRINHALLDRVLKAREDNLLHDDSFKMWERDLDVDEQDELLQLGKIIETFTEEDFAVVVLVAIQNFPEMVFQLMMEEYLNNKEIEK